MAKGLAGRGWTEVGVLGFLGLGTWRFGAQVFGRCYGSDARVNGTTRRALQERV